MHRLKIIFIMVLMLAVLLTGCGAQQAKSDLTKLKVGEVTHSVFYAPQYVAINQGFFQEEGLEVELLNLQGADKVMSALLSNEIQFGLMGPEASIYVANQEREDYVINFAQLTQKDGSFLLGREPVNNFRFDQLTDAEILGGRKGGMPEMTLEYVLKTNGLDVGIDDASKSINVRTDIQFAAMAGAFIAGEGDYVSLFEPTATALQKEGKGYIVASIGEQSGSIPYTAYATPKSYMDVNSDIVQRFTNAVYKGQLFVQEHSSEEIAKIIQPQFTDIPLEDLVIVLERYKSIDAWDHNPFLEKESLEKLMDVMALAGQLDKRADYDTIVTTTYAEEAIKNIK